MPASLQVFVSLGSLKYRKPYTGMWEYLEHFENGNVNVDRSLSLFVGDAAGRIVTKVFFSVSYFALFALYLIAVISNISRFERKKIIPRQIDFLL